MLCLKNANDCVLTILTTWMHLYNSKSDTVNAITNSTLGKRNQL